jgi:hypothetical protein
MTGVIFAAIDVQTIIGGLILLVSFLGWLINVINGVKGNFANKPAPKGEQQSMQRLLEEILKATGTDEAKPVNNPPAADVRTARRAKKAADRQQRQQQPSPKKPVVAPPLPAVTGLGTIPTMASQPLQSFDARSLSRQVAEDLPRDAMSKGVSADFQGTLRSGGSPPATETARSATAPVDRGRLMAMLRDPQSLTAAIIVSEILQPPLARRGRH